MTAQESAAVQGADNPAKSGPMQNFTIRMDQSLLAKLNFVTEKRHLVNTVALIRLYVSEGLERDLERYRWSALQELVDTLRDQGVDEETLKEAFNKVVSTMPPLP